MPEAIGLVYCSVHQVYILPEVSADSERPFYLQIPIIGVSELTKWSEKAFFVCRAILDITHFEICWIAIRR